MPCKIHLSNRIIPIFLLVPALLFLRAAAFDKPETGAAPTTPGPRYGRLIRSGPPCSLWWAEGAYKVMKDDPEPINTASIIRISAARNEYEPFIIVLRPGTRLDGVRVSASPLLRSGKGREDRIEASDISIRLVEYVKVTTPTDMTGKSRLWPDPLSPYQGPFAAQAGENLPLWFTVFVPRDTPPGRYLGEVLISADGGWSCRVPVELRVRSFTLPDRSSVRSSFGLPAGDIKAYHNLETREELEKVIDLYYDDLRRHRVAPEDPFELYPMKTAFYGLNWKGGEFVMEGAHGGRRALKIEDDDTGRNISAEYARPIPMAGRSPARLAFWARTVADKSQYTVICEFFDQDGNWLSAANLVKAFEGTRDWKERYIDIPRLPEEASSMHLSLCPAFRNITGSTTGTAWFDDIVLVSAPGGPGTAGENLVPGGDFEMPIDGMKVSVDFSDFDRAGRRYLDEFGFNSYNLHLKGLGSGSFYSHKEGLFGGFRQGTPEYDALLSQYLKEVEEHLAARGWLGREYIYWFDEPDHKDYPFVREGMLNIRKNAPRLTRFITEHNPGPDIMDVSEIGCTIFNRVDPAAVAELGPKGREFWSYLCTGPKSPWVTLFIDHPAVNMRMWLWMSWRWGLKGILVWRANYWTSPSLFPHGVLQNPWQDPMSYTVGYGIPFGSVSRWGNGDGRFLYPPNREPGKDRKKYLSGPIDSIRWEILREGIEDYEYLVLLKHAAPKSKLLNIPRELFSSGAEYNKDPQILLNYRDKIAAALEKLGTD